MLRGLPLTAWVGQDARYVLAFCDGGCTTNPPAGEVTGGNARAAMRGRPLDPEHGGPARLLVPHLEADSVAGPAGPSF